MAEKDKRPSTTWPCVLDSPAWPMQLNLLLKILDDRAAGHYIGRTVKSKRETSFQRIRLGWFS